MNYPGQTSLHFGDSPDTLGAYPETGGWFPGVHFLQASTVPAGFAGNFQWVQVGDGVTMNFWIHGGFWDGDYRMFSSPITGCDAAPYWAINDLAVDDGPGWVCAAYAGEYSLTMNEDFTMYLMFQPTSDPSGALSNSIYVPIWEGDWSWSGSADNSTGAWALAHGATSGGTYQGPLLGTLPTWSNSLAPITYHR
jgi:hypothetical protein